MSKQQYSIKKILKKTKTKESEDVNLSEKPKIRNNIKVINKNIINNNIQSNEKVEENTQNNNNNDVSNHNNNSYNEFNQNYSLSRECLNYYLSYYYEQDFSLDEKDEPKNAGFFARLFGNHPKIYTILSDLKSERDFIIFLRRNSLNNENDMFEKIFGKILSFFENNICDIEEDKIMKKNNPSTLMGKSNKLLKEKMKSFFEIQKQNNENKNLFEEYKINEIPILMVLQFLTIIEKYPNFIESFVVRCFPQDREIILAFAFYLSSIEYDRLLSGRLNIFFNRNKQVLDNYEDFYLGLFEYSLELFESKYIDQEKFSMLQSEAENMPSSILWKTKIFKLKYPKVNTESSLSKYFNNSSMQK